MARSEGRVSQALLDSLTHGLFLRPLALRSLAPGALLAHVVEARLDLPAHGDASVPELAEGEWCESLCFAVRCLVTGEY